MYDIIMNLVFGMAWKSIKIKLKGMIIMLFLEKERHENIP
jgi:hypothetical protein